MHTHHRRCLITVGGKKGGKASHSLYSVKLSLVQFPFTRDFVSWWNNIITSDVAILTQNFSDYKFKTFIPYYQETKNKKKRLYINAQSAGTGNIESPENYVAII